MSALLLLLTVLVVVVVAAVIALSGRPAVPTLPDGTPVTARDLTELENLRVLVEDLKETAWDHREIDPDLSTILIDKIRTFERHRHDPRGELGM